MKNINELEEFKSDPITCEKIAPSEFALTIPNRHALRDFFANKCKLYVPPSRELTTEFSRKILAGEKSLLPLNGVNWI